MEVKPLKSQWECLLQNLGEWQGSFTRLSPQGKLLEDTPTLVTLEGRNDNQTVRQLVRRYLPSADGSAEPNVQDQVLEYRSLNRSILLFENGAFSQGSIQWGPTAEFGAELGLIDQVSEAAAKNRRLRLVQQFDLEGKLSRLTLIREQRAGTAAAERPPLQLEHLLGEWQGEATTLYPDWRSPDTYPTRLKLQIEAEDRLVQQLSFGEGPATKSITSTARIQGSILLFDQSTPPVQVLLLPDGASSNCPLQVMSGQGFVLEVGWLLQPDLRQRLIRRYDNNGGWVSLTLVTEHKTA